VALQQAINREGDTPLTVEAIPVVFQPNRSAQQLSIRPLDELGHDLSLARYGGG